VNDRDIPSTAPLPATEAWPALPYEAWRDTYATLHLWLQIVGKIRLTLTPWINHSWHVALYPDAAGLTTSLIPYRDRGFDITFDFVAHRLEIRCSDGQRGGFALEPMTVARFYAQILAELQRMGIVVRIHATPNELADATPFDQDETHRAYDPEFAQRFWRIVVQSDRVFTQFRAQFIGKSSPVHVFWGAPDLAVTRFSGRTAPVHPGGVPHLPDRVVREAYSHEVSSCGWWPGNEQVPYPAYYAYAYPEPNGFRTAAIEPADSAFYSEPLGEYLLPYDVVRTAADPDATLLQFLQTTYSAAADLGNWDRAALERSRS
jgi:hypothetical protein